jgi:hypothetical protein
VFDASSSGGKSWKKTARKDEHSLFDNEEKEEMELYDDDGYGGDDFEEDGEDDETKSN